MTSITKPTFTEAKTGTKILLEVSLAKLHNPGARLETANDTVPITTTIAPYAGRLVAKLILLVESEFSVPPDFMDFTVQVLDRDPDKPKVIRIAVDAIIGNMLLNMNSRFAFGTDDGQRLTATITRKEFSMKAKTKDSMFWFLLTWSSAADYREEHIENTLLKPFRLLGWDLESVHRNLDRASGFLQNRITVKYDPTSAYRNISPYSAGLVKLTGEAISTNFEFWCTEEISAVNGWTRCCFSIGCVCGKQKASAINKGKRKAPATGSTADRQAKMLAAARAETAGSSSAQASSAAHMEI
jgi:hypothetical protein